MSKSLELYVKNPGKDFIRNRKLSFETMLQLLVSMGGNSIYKELLEANGYEITTATTSAFVQQRDKILPFALEYLFHEFTKSLADTKSYKGYRLFAADGSELNIPANPGDPDTYFRTSEDKRGYNMLHLNAMYDLCAKLYIDATVQEPRCSNENKALCEMVDRSPIEGNVIVIADRFYESYNNLAHIENKGWNYVIRARDLGSTGIVSALPLPSGGEFDVCFDRILTRKLTNEVKAHPEIYRHIPRTSKFDFFDLHNNQFHPISFRVVRFKVGNFYETVLTNLSQADFPSEELKTLYNMRWGIETSFRELKYSVGLVNFHAKKRECIVQEIFARMIMHNFAEMIISKAASSKANAKYAYQINFTVAILICRRFLRCHHYERPPDIEALIRKNVLPIRPNRVSLRKPRRKSACAFVYRIA
jgi:hypothetical protein